MSSRLSLVLILIILCGYCGLLTYDFMRTNKFSTICLKECQAAYGKDITSATGNLTNSLVSCTCFRHKGFPIPLYINFSKEEKEIIQLPRCHVRNN